MTLLTFILNVINLISESVVLTKNVKTSEKLFKITPTDGSSCPVPQLVIRGEVHSEIETVT
jgi:hypothetical protein